MNRNNRRKAFLTAGIAGLALSCLVAGSAVLAAPISAEEAAHSKYFEARTPVRHAIIFANSNYVSLTTVPSGKKDLELMRKFFKDAGYHIWPEEGDGQFKTVDDAYDVLLKAREQIQPGDIVVIYYSGHGFFYGNQNWLVPLNYPAGPVGAQLLFQNAVGLNDIINGLAAKRMDFVVPILDSCRTWIDLSLSKGKRVVGTEARVPDPRLTGFNISGPSLLAWMIGVPTASGGQTLGLEDEGQPSLYTGLLAEALRTKTDVKELQTALKLEVKHLVDAHKINEEDMAPRFMANELGFDFSLAPNEAIDDRQEFDWKQVLREPSRQLVSDYLVANPGSKYSSAAWKYLDDHANEPLDASGNSATSADAIDMSFEAAKASGKMVAIATPAFTAKFPRNMLGLESPNAIVTSTSIAYADKATDFDGIFAQKYRFAGSKLRFDLDALSSIAVVTGNLKADALTQPRVNAPVIAEFDKSTLFSVSETYFDETRKKLFAKVRPRLKGAIMTESWIGFDYDKNSKQLFNVLNRALHQDTFSADGIAGKSKHTIKAVTQEVLGASNEILWVSIAARYRPSDISALQRELDDAGDEKTRAAIIVEIDKVREKDSRALSEARLRVQSARLQLIDTGIAGDRISTVEDQTLAADESIRLRFFGSR